MTREIAGASPGASGSGQSLVPAVTDARESHATMDRPDLPPRAAGDPTRKRGSWSTWSGHAWVGLAARLYLGGLFVLASLHKIQHPGSFAVDVATYRLLPLTLVNLFSISVPWVELAAGLCLLLGLRVRGAALVVAGLMVAFMVALGWALAQGLEMSCGCFASQSVKEQDPISWRTLIRDSAWLLLAAYVTWFDRTPIGLERLLRKR